MNKRIKQFYKMKINVEHYSQGQLESRNSDSHSFYSPSFVKITDSSVILLDYFFPLNKFCIVVQTNNLNHEQEY